VVIFYPTYCCVVHLTVHNDLVFSGGGLDVEEFVRKLHFSLSYLFVGSHPSSPFHTMSRWWN